MPIYDHSSLNTYIMRNVSGKSCRENPNTHFTFKNLFFSKNRVFYEIMWKNIAQPDRLQMTVQYGACWVTKAIDTYSGYVMIFHGKNSYAKTPKNTTFQYTAYIAFPYVQNLHQFRCTQQKVPGKSKVQSTL
jgi:hypothetical protein